MNAIGYTETLLEGEISNYQARRQTRRCDGPPSSTYPSSGEIPASDTLYLTRPSTDIDGYRIPQYRMVRHGTEHSVNDTLEEGKNPCDGDYSAACASQDPTEKSLLWRPDETGCRAGR